MPTDLLCQAWYYVSTYQQEHPQTNLLPFPYWYQGLGPHIKPTQPTAALSKYYTDHTIQHSATPVYFMIQAVPALTVTTMKAYLPALATEF